MRRDSRQDSGWLALGWRRLRSRGRTILAFALAVLAAFLAAPIAPDGIPGLGLGLGPGAAIAQTPRLTDIRATGNGLVLRLTGASLPNLPVSVQRIANPDRLAVDLPGIEVPAFLHNSQCPESLWGQPGAGGAISEAAPHCPGGLGFGGSPGGLASGVCEGWGVVVAAADRPAPQAQVVTTVPLSSPPASPLPLPLGTTSTLEPIPVPTVTPIGSTLPLFPQPGAPTANPAPITATGGSRLQAILIDATGQILLRGDRPFAYRGSADPATNTYNLTIEGAAIADNFVRPALPANSPIERIRLTAQGNFVTVGVKVSPGWRVQELGNVDANQVALQVASADGRPPTLPTVAQAPMPATRGRGVVLIDPGHGGRDPGAVANSVREKDVVLSVGLRAGQLLQKMGYTVVYTRTDDREVELAPRVQLAERVRADVFVSVHANAVDPRLASVNGIETFHAPNSAAGRELAQFIQREALAATGANDRRVKTARFYVVSRTSMPSVLLETGFVTNPQEAAISPIPLTKTVWPRRSPGALSPICNNGARGKGACYINDCCNAHSLPKPMELPTALRPIVTFAHPLFMTLVLGYTLYTGYLGWQWRQTRKESDNEKKKELTRQGFNQRHFQTSSILLVFLVLGAFGGMAVTYINNGKLFVGPHLLAGLAMAALAVISTALVPAMLKAKDWARSAHIGLNTVLVGLFFWQTVTGFEIVQRILDSMAKGS
ncbi:MAG: DUF4079 family protein [Oscillatoriales cyanobacterium SM2_1_8]|nr:DUF4079 family protein [Oscillatoriales cyanobacterium SM2_1_8]